MSLTLVAIGLVVLVVLFFYLGLPETIDKWMIRQTYDGEAATKRLVALQERGRVSQEKFDEIFDDIQKVFGEKMKEVERSIRLHNSIDARRARVTRRRPLQRKLGRIA